jgi:hypothetical protein
VRRNGIRASRRGCIQSDAVIPQRSSNLDGPHAQPYIAAYDVKRRTLLRPPPPLLRGTGAFARLIVSLPPD